MKNPRVGVASERRAVEHPWLPRMKNGGRLSSGSRM
ncbi:hypothetical protein PF003_g39889 [Phytophthora fragariae]|nr:hypothetical protein PF003_g39889 [Phytophthora fragariae]